MNNIGQHFNTYLLFANSAVKAVQRGVDEWLDDCAGTAGGVGACVGTCVLAGVHSGCIGGGSGGVGRRSGSRSIVGSCWGWSRLIVGSRGGGIAGGVVKSGGSVVHKRSGVVHGVDGSGGVVDRMTVMILLPGVQVNLGDGDSVTGNQRVAEIKKKTLFIIIKAIFS